MTRNQALAKRLRTRAVRIVVALLAMIPVTAESGSSQLSTLQVISVVGPSTLISSGAYNLLNQRTTADRSQFFVYQDADSGFNHGFPSGFFHGPAQNPPPYPTINTACIDDMSAPQGCSTDNSRLDQTHGTVVQMGFAPMASGQFAGIDFEEPQGYVGSLSGIGYDLTGATYILFSARSPTGITLEFGAGGQVTQPVALFASSTYTTLCVAVQGPAQRVCPLNAATKLDLLPPMPPNVALDITKMHILFTVQSTGPAGGVVLLDNIQYLPLPTAQSNALSLPLSTQTFGAIPSQQAPLPDQANRNIASTYEASLTMLALFARGTPADITNARAIADAFVYALGHDDSGDPLPVAVGGATGLHNAYEAGDLSLLNSQGAGSGQAGQIRFAGFTATQTGCGPTAYCLVLDGATGGNNAFAVLALLAAYKQTGSQSYLTAALTIGNWIYEQLLDRSGTGFGGYFLGYPDMGVIPKALQTGKSTENNADIFAALNALAAAETALGNVSAANSWNARAKIAGDFVIAMFDASRGCFFAGTVPPNTSGRGIDPTGPRRGQDIINVYDFFDSNSFTYLALSQSAQYANAIPWPAVASCLSRFQASVVVGGATYSGYSITRAPLSGPNGVAWEFTGQAAVVLRLAGGNPAPVVGAIDAAQQTAPFGDTQGLVAATLQGGDTLPPAAQCLDTPFQCIPERVGIAATAWAIFAETGANPLLGSSPLLSSSPLLAAVLPASRSVQIGKTATAFATIINTGATTASACNISALGGLPLNFLYQTTNPATNALTGTANTPVDIPGNNGSQSFGSQSFVIALTPTATIAPIDAQFSFACANANPAPIVVGLDTLLLSGSATPTPDVIALAGTQTNDGIVQIPGASGTGAFAIATVNVGSSGAITASTKTGAARLPLTLTICQSNPSNGQCLAPAAANVTTTINANATPTFSIFATASGAIPLDPANSRIFVVFSDSANAVRGETSVAVQTQ